MSIILYKSALFYKTKPIYSLCVLRPFDFAQDKDAYCERNLKKQSQFLLGLNLRKFFEINRICEIIRFRGMKKTNPNKANLKTGLKTWYSETQEFLRFSQPDSDLPDVFNTPYSRGFSSFQDTLNRNRAKARDPQER